MPLERQQKHYSQSVLLGTGFREAQQFHSSIAVSVTLIAGKVDPKDGRRPGSVVSVFSDFFSQPTSDSHPISPFLTFSQARLKCLQHYVPMTHIQFTDHFYITYI